jgi:cytochrome b561
MLGLGGLSNLIKGKAMKPLNYSIPQRILHWGMALLILFNLIFSDGMELWNRTVRKGEVVTPEILASANIHAYVGISILVFALLRLLLRYTQGVPASPAHEPQLVKLGGMAAHGLLYLMFFIMPLSGIAKYYFGAELPGELHGGIFKVILWALIVLHVAGALAQKFYFKTDVLDRMTKGVKA